MTNLQTALIALATSAIGIAVSYGYLPKGDEQQMISIAGIVLGVLIHFGNHVEQNRKLRAAQNPPVVPVSNQVVDASAKAAAAVNDLKVAIAALETPAA